jgi:hypothetical protein
MATNNWLYPLSKTSGHRFKSRGKRTPDTCFGCFVHLHLSGYEDDHWYLATNFRRVQKGDRIWAYYGTADENQGVVALGSIADPNASFRDGTPGIKIQWDRAATRKLISRSVHAEVIRMFIKRPRAAVVALDKYPDLVEILENAAGLND